MDKKNDAIMGAFTTQELAKKSLSLTFSRTVPEENRAERIAEYLVLPLDLYDHVEHL